MTTLTKPTTYRITTDTAELPKGSRFTVRRAPIRDGQLALVQVGQFLIVGRMFGDWIIQPHRLIDCRGASVRIIGVVA